MTATDRLSPIGTLTTGERATARRIAAGNPGALEPAIRAALCIDDGEQTVGEMLALLRRDVTCAS